MGNQLIEARPIWGKGELQRLFYYPQIIFEPNGMTIRGDGDDIFRFGNEVFRNILYRAVSYAYKRYNYKDKKNGLFFEPIERGILDQGYRYDPRVFTRRTIAEIADNLDKQTFIIRYMSQTDKFAVLRQLDTFDPYRRSSKWTKKHSASRSPMESSFDMGKTMRGLMKIGFNILAAYCEKTPVDRSAFRGVVKLLLGENSPSPELVKRNGFVYAADLAELSAPNRAHAFRLTWMGNESARLFEFFWWSYMCDSCLPGRKSRGVEHLERCGTITLKRLESWILKNFTTNSCPHQMEGDSGHRPECQTYKPLC